MPRRLVRLLVYASAFVALAVVVARVADHTIDVVEARRLPRWDLATHLAHGWMDYHFLATGQWPRLLWDLWLQAYWPPMPSIWQVPFYVALGGGMAGGTVEQPGRLRPDRYGRHGDPLAAVERRGGAADRDPSRFWCRRRTCWRTRRWR